MSPNSFFLVATLDLGRFVSADPFAQLLEDRQSFNRYACVLNNPLSYTDQSGYFFNKISDWIGDNWKSVFVIVAGVVIEIWVGPAGLMALSMPEVNATFLGAVVSGAVTKYPLNISFVHITLISGASCGSSRFLYSMVTGARCSALRLSSSKSSLYI
ncbi:hypothetical protein [Rubellicoccus peritrichatus]|uniref:Uncharacterized protein n=1 Tax=Rubellicoccus peritrichatus TaxID=3080537 RepID=A0AAQ3LGT9_9BACT|nr:hypothetical protein [Puniceicoccus sp. CR14]WOO43630.1 hypothetical protein RZN69_11070 [Puniceicoccus sp. CR14]